MSTIAILRAGTIRHYRRERDPRQPIGDCYWGLLTLRKDRRNFNNSRRSVVFSRDEALPVVRTVAAVHAAQRGRCPVGEAPGAVPKEVSRGYAPFLSCRARLVRRRCVHGHEEERYPAGIRHVVARLGGDHDEGACRGFVLSVADADV